METTKTVRGLGHGTHKESVRAAIIQPGEEKVSWDPFAIFMGLMGGLQRRWSHNLLRGVQEEDERQQMRCSKGKL